MAGIEPLGTMMTYAAQPTQAAAPVAPATTTISESTDGQNMDASVARIDQETLAVTKLAENGEGSTESGEGGSAGSGAGSADQEMMRKALEELNKKATSVTSEFGIHEKTNRITIKIVDKKTKEVIKELPPEKMLDMIAKIWETSGLIVDEKR